VQPITEWQAPDPERFHDEILPRSEPAVLRGAVRDWPAVQRAADSPAALSAYLKRFDSGKGVDVLITPPHARGRLFYNEGMTAFNYAHNKMSLSAVSEKLLRYAAFDNRPALAAQSALVRDCLPGFREENALPFLEPDIEPRVWLGSAFITPAHFDESHNIACVVAGRRRFTLFPPEQVANLYIGPLDFAPTGTPISMVDFAAPDFGRFPRFREALDAARVAELEPGDALLIPALWWHHVQSLSKYNLLVNYWWRGAGGMTTRANSALNCLLHCLVDLKPLPREQRAAWRALLDYYVFGDVDPAAHIPEHRRSVLGPMSPELARQVRAFLMRQMQEG
jgi:hypothetical protein